jgi:hypothetical protein
MELKKILEKASKGDIIFIDEFTDKHRVIRGQGNAYILHALLQEYREWIIKNRGNPDTNKGDSKRKSEEV